MALVYSAINLVGTDVLRLWKFRFGPLPNCVGGRWMGIVIEFPTKRNVPKGSAVLQPVPAFAQITPAPSRKTRRTNTAGLKVKTIFLSLLRTFGASIWVVLVCLWPLARWVATIDLSFQLIRTAYYWNNPSIAAGWTFLLHFAAFTAWTYLVGVHRPAGFRNLTPAGPGEKKLQPETPAIPKRLVAHH